MIWGFRYMKKLVLRSLVFAALVGTLAVCSADGPAAPQPAEQPNASLLGGDGLLGLGGTDGLVDNLLSPLSCRTSGYGSVTKTIGSAGGTIKVGPHTLSIPSGALAKNVSITMSAPKGNYIETQFQPHGLTFLKETNLTLSYKECGLLVLNPKVAYVDDNKNILEVVLSLPNLLGKTVTGRVKHFSGYLVSE
jgi:hypothetical protein